eukprot:scaffold155360_cov25-Tisochrysis_lutea.AAC.1
MCIVGASGSSLHCQSEVTRYFNQLREMLVVEEPYVRFMHKIPDARVCPGYEEFLTGSPARIGPWTEFSMIHDFRRYNSFQPAAPNDSKKVWATMEQWHGMHQRSSSIGLLPITFTEPHMPQAR